MSGYQIGSVADFVSQKVKNEEPKTSKGNREILDQLFASSQTPARVEHVPISVSQPKKRKKRKADDFQITNVAKGKKLKPNDDAEDEDIEQILDLPDDEAEEDDETTAVSENVTRKLKKIENKNLKKKSKKNEEEEDNGRVVIVKNLPIKVKKKTVRNLLSQFGKVVAVWIRCAPLPDTAMPKKVAIIKQDFHPERQSITAYVRFEDAESAQKAVSLTGTVFKEHHLTVNLITGNSKPELSKGIFVGNLNFGVEDEALWKHFGECGTIRDVRVVRDSSSGIGKGFAYVNFESADSVELALKLNKSLLENREVRVERCKNKPKKPKIGEERVANRGKSNPRESDPKSGAYRRLQQKKNKLDRDNKQSGWIKAMKQRKKDSAAKNLSSTVQSFAGETTNSDSRSHKPKRPGKAIKKTKEELRRRSIAAKLTAV